MRDPHRLVVVARERIVARYAPRRPPRGAPPPSASARLKSDSLRYDRGLLFHLPDGKVGVQEPCNVRLFAGDGLSTRLSERFFLSSVLLFDPLSSRRTGGPGGGGLGRPLAEDPRRCDDVGHVGPEGREGRATEHRGKRSGTLWCTIHLMVYRPPQVKTPDGRFQHGHYRLRGVQHVLKGVHGSPNDHREPDDGDVRDSQKLGSVCRDVVGLEVTSHGG
eukprot:293432-Prorocentrum_minimum.AAC.1